jgi:hypothetical protein
MNYKMKQFFHALWQYLNQSLTPNPEVESVWKPSRFWYLYKLKSLESSWQKEAYLPQHESRGQDEYRAGN